MRKVIFFAVMICSVTSVAANDSLADVLIISHKSQTTDFGEQEIRELYLGKIKMRQIELFDQSEGQSARDEFINKFLSKSESELKQQRSILVFSGHRVPSVLPDDKTVLERVKANEKAIGYVSGDFAQKFTQDMKDVKVLFTVGRK